MNYDNILTGDLYYEHYLSITYIATIRKQPEYEIREAIEDKIQSRARKSLKAIDLTTISKHTPLVKSIVTQLYLIRNELHRRYNRELTIDDKTNFEKADNYIKKIRFLSIDEWAGYKDDVTIVEETGGYVTVNEVFICENGNSESLLKYAKTLSDKLYIKPDKIMPVTKTYDEKLAMFDDLTNEHTKD